MGLATPNFFHVLVRAEYFDVQTGVLTSKLSDNPQKVSGLAGITLAGYVASHLALVLECAMN